MLSEELSYVSRRDPFWKRWIMRAIENASGRRRLLPVYYRWRAAAGTSPRMMGVLLDMLGTRLDLQAPAWPITVPPQLPLVIVANHPFGIGDGIALLALAEALGRPYRILINSDFMKLPEIRPYALPIDFSETREAIATNLASRSEARRLLRQGVTIVVFPAGGVATAEVPAGKAEELPWKPFTARLIQQAQAAVLPVYFEGQNSALFHLISRYSLMLRLSLLVSEFRHFVGATIRVHIGAVVPFEALAGRADRGALTDELYALVHRLAPDAAALGSERLKPRPAVARRRYPWDPPRRVLADIRTRLQ
ncbi:MAG TPA: lysophospholipid acyltransferase family protein [Xanthobacteraceae bacterium]